MFYFLLKLAAKMKSKKQKVFIIRAKEFFPYDITSEYTKYIIISKNVLKFNNL